MPQRPDAGPSTAPAAPAHRAGRHRRVPGQGHRVEVDGWAAAVLLIVLGVGLAIGLAVLVRARPHALAVPDDPGAVTGSTAGATAGPWSTVGATASASPSSGPSTLVVHVAGLVRSPGVVTLTPGARVADAVVAAGGVSPGGDPATVNLARPVVDGEQIVVRESGAPLPPAASGAGSAAAGAPLDLNGADQHALEQLPGVGPVLAGRILEWRTKHGRFSSVDELREVSGIGAKVFAALADRVRV
ncbi:MAG TPA: helix-hairpin-helix domain-containing protein [Actinomycetes bacterium]|nr:helix-hairpin-helix domain-containing protein [Actinomycetes bacterium]